MNSDVMQYARLTSAALVGVFALILLASAAQAQRVKRGAVTPPPPGPPVASKL